MNCEERPDQPENPVEKANFISRLLFWWVNPLMRKGYKRELQIEDVYKQRRCDESERLTDRLEREFEKELEWAKVGNKDDPYKPSYLKALVRTFGMRYMLIGLGCAFEELFIRVFQAVIVIRFLAYFSPDKGGLSEAEAYSYGGALVCFLAMYTISHHVIFVDLELTGMRVRVASCALIYRKALRLSQASLRESSVGQMVNMLSNDVEKFDRALMFLHWLWIGPLQLAVVVALTWSAMGPSVLAGAVIILMGVPLQGWISRMFSHLRRQTATLTDERIRVMHEIINGVKVIKMYGWEHAFAEHNAGAREREMGVIRKTNNFRAFNFGYFLVSMPVALVAILVPFTLTGGVLTAEKLFLTLNLYRVSRLTMTMFFPIATSSIGEIRVSIKRIQEFLLREEVSDKSVCMERKTDQETAALQLKGVSASWYKTGGEMTLKDVTMEVSPGQLCVIGGPVGSGKSSLLKCLLGEIPVNSGSVRVGGTISYAAQEPWVFSGSIRQNVLFGLPFEEERYRAVLNACALNTDLLSWEHGDGTLVGERGVALSGGQRARVNLARAVYRKADAYLLDDPLSAVDAHVGKHLFAECVRGFLRNKIVLLVTHQLQYAKEADSICMINRGEVKAMGTLTEIRDILDEDFSDFMKKDEKEDEEDDPVALKKEADEPKHVNIPNGSEAKGVDESSSLIPEVKTSQPAKGIAKESQASGSVSRSVYREYATSGAGMCFLALGGVIQVLSHATFVMQQILLAMWTSDGDVIEAERRMNNSTSNEATEVNSETISINTTNTANNNNNFPHNITDEEYLAVYAGVVSIFVVVSFAYPAHFYHVCTSASIRLHNNMFGQILRAPMRFFETSPVGRVLNRFTKDLGTVDEMLPGIILDVMAIFLTFFCLIVLIVISRPIVIAPSLVIFVIFYYLKKVFISSSRPVKRLEAAAKSPVFSQIASSLQGLTTIRAFGAEGMLVKEFDRLQDVHTSAFFTYLSMNRWFGVALDWTITVYSAICVFSFMLFDDGSQSGYVGVVLTSCLNMVGMMQWGLRQSAVMENTMTSVERIAEYGRLQSEAELESKGGGDFLKDSSGEVEFSDVSLRYAADEKYVLRGINFKTESKEKVGIVGRTGAGKSSLITAIFRLAEPEGQILIGGVPTGSLGLHELRKAISIIPQEPLIFSGTLRKNLDPFEEYQDKDLWESLKQVQMDSAACISKDGLETLLADSGSNLSAGESQLVCLARAVLRKNKIIVMDEATANVDPRTDALIQETIRSCFKDCTILTIAHRLHTVMDSDRILALSDGAVEEFDTPWNLLQKEDGLLSRLVRNTGRSTEFELRRIAQEKAQRKAE